MPDLLAPRAAKQWKEVWYRPVHHLADGHLGGRGAPDLESYPPPSGGSWQVMGRDPLKFNHFIAVEGLEPVPDVSKGHTVSKWSHPSILKITAVLLSPAAVNLPIPKGEGVSGQFWNLRKGVLPYSNDKGGPIAQRTSLPSYYVLSQRGLVESMGNFARIIENPSARNCTQEERHLYILVWL